MRRGVGVMYQPVAWRLTSCSQRRTTDKGLVQEQELDVGANDGDRVRHRHIRLISVASIDYVIHEPFWLDLCVSLFAVLPYSHTRASPFIWIRLVADV